MCLESRVGQVSVDQFMCKSRKTDFVDVEPPLQSLRLNTRLSNKSWVCDHRFLGFSSTHMIASSLELMIRMRKIPLPR